jgi:hypothetical protein
MKYRIISFLFFTFSASFLVQGQVDIAGEIIAFEKDTDSGDQELRIKWSIEKAAAWKAKYLPALEAYPVSINLVLKEDSSKFERYQILISLPLDGQYAFQFESLNSTGDIVIQNYNTGKELYANTKSGIEISSFLRGQEFLISFPTGRQESLILKKIFVRENFEGSQRDLGFEGALECEENFACDQGNLWELQSRSVVRIRMVLEEGIGWCTGSLMNNTAKDGRPFILSASHCQYGFTPLYENWRFDFGYESLGCENPVSEPIYQSLTGCTLRARGQDSDFLLLELVEDIPVEYNVYYNGWDHRDNYLPDTVALIHHPSADIKKISIDYDPSAIFQFNIFWDEGFSTPAKYHYKSFFDFGTHEGGSSGGPLFDTRGLLIGQLHGGRADCEENFAYSGRLHKSWDSGSLESEILGIWLDPLGTGQDTLHGMLHPDLGSTYAVHGQVNDMNGAPMKNILIKIEGDVTLDVMTDSLGQFNLPIVSRSDNIVIKPRKNTTVANGVTAIDLLLIQKHLLNILPFTQQSELLAADVSGNNKVTGTDLVLIQKLLLGINASFPGRQSWTFDPISIQLENITEPTINLNIMGIKLGDVNGTADPDE